MLHLLRRLRAPAIAIVALALSASLALGAQSPAWAQAAHRPVGSTVSLTGDEEAGDEEEAGSDEEAGDDEDAGEDENAGEDVDAGDDQDAESDEEAGQDEANDEAGENCSTDPTTLTAEDLAAANHGSIVCWAASQATWPAWFSNHGAFVRCWAHQGKADAVSCTEDPTTLETVEGDAAGDHAPATHGKGHGHAKASGKAKHQK